MSKNLENLLIDLSSNPEQLSRFKNNPADVLAQSSLTGDERAAVTSRDSQQLADALGSTGFALGLGVEIITPSKAPAKRKAPGKKKGPAKKKTPPRKKAPARKKTPAKKRPAKRAPAKRAPARRAPARRVPAKKSPPKSSKKR
jgi:hypothetical protein